MADLRTSELPLQIEYKEKAYLKIPAISAQIECKETSDLCLSNIQLFAEYIENGFLESSELIGQVEYPYLDTINSNQENIYKLWGFLNVTEILTYSITTPLTPKKFWTGDIQISEYSIIETVNLSQEFIYAISEQTPAGKEQTFNYSLLPTDVPLEITNPSRQILLDSQDVTDKVLNCKITFSKSTFVGTIDITWKDWDIFNVIDCSELETNYQKERLEVLTKTDGDWTSQGKFFLEKRDAKVTPNEILPSLWGRNKPALLAEPYSQTITKTWTVQTTAKTIAMEVINGLVTLDWQIEDYAIPAGILSADKERPIGIITKLAGALGAIVTTDKTGQLRVIYKWQI